MAARGPATRPAAARYATSLRWRSRGTCIRGSTIPRSREAKLPIRVHAASVALTELEWATDVNELDRRAFQRHTAPCASSGDSRLYRSENLRQICGRIRGKTSLLGHQWNKRAERNACISAENFAGPCIACAVRQSGFDSRPAAGFRARLSAATLKWVVHRASRTTYVWARLLMS